MSKFTDEARKTILDAFRINPSIPSAATKAGIHASTLRSWLQRGEDGTDPDYAQFALDCQEARQTMKDEVVASLLRIATDELHPQATRAAHQLLTNLYPMEFSTVKHVVTHKANDEPAMDLSAIPSDELRVFLKTLKRVQASNEEGEPLALPPSLSVIDVVQKPSKDAN